MQFSIDNDGVDHLNVYSKARTRLGQDLSNFSHHPIEHPELGHFASIEGLWYWMTRQDEKLRHVHGYEAKRLGKSLPKVKEWPEAEFTRLIKLGLTAKMDQHPELMNALAKTSLPLTHYYVYRFGGIPKIVEPKGYEWIIAHLEDLRHARNPEADMGNNELIREKRQRELAREESSQMGLF